MNLRRTKLLGTLAFYISLPGLYYYLQRNERTRVVITADDDVLVLKGWYGSNRWMLPGGGVHKEEDITAAAIREVIEETGIVLKPEQFVHLGSSRQWDTYGFRFVCHSFAIELDSKPQLLRQNLEISHAMWRPAKTVAADIHGTLKVTRVAVATWMKSKKLL